jgi:hypothetical protein
MYYFTITLTIWDLNSGKISTLGHLEFLLSLPLSLEQDFSNYTIVNLWGKASSLIE